MYFITKHIFTEYKLICALLGISRHSPFTTMLIRQLITFIALWAIAKSDVTPQISPNNPLIKRFIDTFLYQLGDQLDFVYDVSQVSAKDAAKILYEKVYQENVELHYKHPEKIAKVEADAIGATFGRLNPETFAQADAGSTAQLFLNSDQLTEENVDSLAMFYAKNIMRGVNNYKDSIHLAGLEDGYTHFAKHQGVLSEANDLVVDTLYASYLHYCVGDLEHGHGHVAKKHNWDESK